MRVAERLNAIDILGLGNQRALEVALGVGKPLHMQMDHANVGKCPQVIWRGCENALVEAFGLRELTTMEVPLGRDRKYRLVGSVRREKNRCSEENDYEKCLHGLRRWE